MSDHGEVPDRRSGHDRRGYWRGGRRKSDWPATVTEAPTCPRCASPEAKYVDATPTVIFWACHRCRHEWSSGLDGKPRNE